MTDIEIHRAIDAILATEDVFEKLRLLEELLDKAPEIRWLTQIIAKGGS